MTRLEIICLVLFFVFGCAGSKLLAFVAGGVLLLSLYRRTQGVPPS